VHVAVALTNKDMSPNNEFTTRRQGAAIVAWRGSLRAERYFTELCFDVRTTNVYVN